MGYFGDFDSALEEQRAYEEYVRKQQQSQEPDVVPCFNCGSQMYEESSNHEENICDDCFFQASGKPKNNPVDNPH